MDGRGRGRRYLFGVVKADLAGCHGGVFEEVGPGGVDYGYIVLFVPYTCRNQLAQNILHGTVGSFNYTAIGLKDEELGVVQRV